MPRTILVTGGTGALGTAVTKRLLGDGHRVAATWMIKEEASDFSAWVPPADAAGSITFLTSQAAGQLRGAWLPVYGSA